MNVFQESQNDRVHTLDARSWWTDNIARNISGRKIRSTSDTDVTRLAGDCTTVDGRELDGYFSKPTHTARSVNETVNSHRQRWWIISSRIKGIGNCSGMRATGRQCASVVTIPRQQKKMGDGEDNLLRTLIFLVRG